MTFTYVFVSVPLKLIFALAVAMLMNQKLRGVTFYRAVYYIPTLLGGSVALGEHLLRHDREWAPKAARVRLSWSASEVVTSPLRIRTVSRRINTRPAPSCTVTTGGRVSML